jgi:hypothetical protein
MILLVTNKRKILSVEEKPTLIREMENGWERNKLMYVGKFISQIMRSKNLEKQNLSIIVQ